LNPQFKKFVNFNLIFLGVCFMRNARRIALVCLLFVFVSLATADVKLPAVINSNMVMQRETDAPVWGWADPGEKITVKACWKASAETTADADGKWSVKIKTPKAGGPHELTIQGKNTIILKNILIGEVWVCSGQSNMVWPMSKSKNPKKDISAAKYPNIRLFTVTRKIAAEPKDDCEGNWSECSPETVKDFSAVGYFFGKHLFDEMDVPIGLISTNWGGTLAEAWTRKEILESDKDFMPIIKRHEKAAKWHHNSPSGLYNAMISPLIPFAIKGAIWYQGEANVNRAYQYRTLFPTMITNWRTDWGQGDFPFYYVQIAPCNYYKSNPSHELREAQMLTLSLKNTGMAVISDIGNALDIHPKNKLDVGKRLALWALAKDYGKKDIVYSGPIYKSMKTEGNKIRLSFDYTGSGLKTMDGKEISHLTIAGADKKFVAAKGVIDSGNVVVSCETVKNPVSVRYGWSNTAEPNLANKEGLPASSFRTDDWPGMTYRAR
jgi:sialate O-acetylesterase